MYLFVQILTPVQVQFAGYTTSVDTATAGVCVFALIPGQDTPVLDMVRLC